MLIKFTKSNKESRKNLQSDIDYDYLKKLIQYLPLIERKLILDNVNNFDILWKDIKESLSKTATKNLYKLSKHYFMQINWRKMFSEIEIATDIPEMNRLEQHWEFPKGHRNFEDKDYIETIVREVCEELNCKPSDFNINKSKYFNSFHKTMNGKSYNVFYYIGKFNGNIDTNKKYKDYTIIQKKEIKNIKWLTINDVKNCMPYYISQAFEKFINE
jgi:hypothetical protein